MQAANASFDPAVAFKLKDRIEGPTETFTRKPWSNPKCCPKEETHAEGERERERERKREREREIEIKRTPRYAIGFFGSGAKGGVLG